MNRKDIPLIDIEHFLAVNHEQWHGEGFFITSEISPYLQEHPNRLSFYAIALCNGGLHRTEINLKPHTLTANSFMALKPLQTVNQLEIKDYSGVLILFNKNFFLRSGADLHLLQSLQFFSDDATPVVSFPETSARVLMDEFVQLRYKASRVDHPYRKEIVRNLLVNFLYESDVLYRKENAGADKRLTHKEELARQFQELVALHFRQRHDVQYYADALYISPKYLSELLRETLGKNASELIYEALLTEAAILLKTTSLAIAQIAGTLHFADASAFIHFFKKHTGQSPSAYRKGG